VTEADIMLSVTLTVKNSDQQQLDKNFKVNLFLSERKNLKEINIFNVCFCHEIFSDTSNFSVMKQASNFNLHCSVVAARR
jgi:hypothetical protein